MFVYSYSTINKQSTTSYYVKLTFSVLPEEIRVLGRISSLFLVIYKDLQTMTCINVEPLEKHIKIPVNRASLLRKWQIHLALSCYSTGKSSSADLLLNNRQDYATVAGQDGQPIQMKGVSSRNRMFSGKVLISLLTCV